MVSLFCIYKGSIEMCKITILNSHALREKKNKNLIKKWLLKQKSAKLHLQKTALQPKLKFFVEVLFCFVWLLTK
jgi:hypothetical protein